VALVGNSATERGVDAGEFQEAAERKTGEAVAADLFVADGSRVGTWYYLLQRYFWRPGRHADLVLINFYKTDLADADQEEVGRLAQFFTTPADWPELFHTDLRQLDQQADFLLSSVWATYAARFRIKDRLLEALIPNYAGYTSQVNDVNWRHVRQKGVTSHQAPTYRELRRLLSQAQCAGTRLCFVAYPTRGYARNTTYPVDPEAVRLIREAGMEFVDLRQMTELAADRYADEIHLNEAGRRVYSRQLGEAVSPMIRSAMEQTGPKLRVVTARRSPHSHPLRHVGQEYR
jgi:hypothetical protein